MYLQKETIDLAQAVEYKNAVIDSFEEKRSDVTAADLHTMAFSEANEISVPDPSSNQRCKAKWMEEYVVDSDVGQAVRLVVLQSQKT